MYNTVLTIHSYWAFLVLLVLLLAGLNALVKFSSNKPFTDNDLRISLFGLITSHIQLLIGIVLYFVSDKFNAWSEVGSEVMKIPALRLVLVEHPLMNVIAIALITIGWSKHKKETTAKRKFGKIALFYLLGLVFLLARIPYAQWFA
ncbi:hypothetical protein SAMN05216480_11329 [Pustulibacterium marinum]|uniref:50S ribosomal protein L27 n=1 Tax=Pustulibacterium marinum TaxID=1224947 RepID=A0A1I7I648_9FLAO|nr:hypothetical protein [Pustulibacterium marinum]SFU68413.1 hypothetical protein SAMN05216480_11329 [Pustulibacterium marinum]